MMKKLFLSMISLALPLLASAYDCKVDGIYYNLKPDEKTAEVTYQTYDTDNQSDYSGFVDIPDKFTYNSVEYSVTSIGSSAFQGCSGLTSLSIPNSVTSIGYSAFFHCSGLTSVTIPNSVPLIEKETFRGCTSLTSVTIPNSVTSIESSAFYGCSSLTSVTIPNSVTSIKAYAFQKCTSLTSVTIPKSVKSIGYSAFSECENIEQVVSDIHMVFNLDESVFSYITYINAMLYVPVGRSKSYQAATGWKNFIYIIEGTPSYINPADIENVETVKEAERYDTSGSQINKSHRGLNIIRMSDGTVKKVVVK